MTHVEAAQTNQETHASYVTSVGGFGFQDRTYGRRVYTPHTPLSSAEAIGFYIQETHNQLADKEHGRSMVRGLVTQSALFGALQDEGTRSHLEVAVPVGNTETEDLWFVVFGQNGSERQSMHTSEVISARKRELSQRSVISPRELVENVLANGGSFHRDLEDTSVRAQVSQLWSERFDWTQEEIEGLTQRLEEEQLKPSSDRSVWFSAVVNQQGRVTGVAMAEALDLPTGNEGHLRMIESTEWAAPPRDEEVQITHIKEAVAHVSAQAYADNPDENTFVFAECNMINAAPAVAISTGYEFPQVTIADFSPKQMLPQNVHIGDNLEEGSYRDFLWMHISPRFREMHYNNSTVAHIMQITGK